MSQNIYANSAQSAVKKRYNAATSRPVDPQMASPALQGPEGDLDARTSEGGWRSSLKDTGASMKESIQGATVGGVAGGVADAAAEMGESAAYGTQAADEANAAIGNARDRFAGQQPLMDLFKLQGV